MKQNSRRAPRRTRIVLPAGVAALALALAACSGGGSPQATGAAAPAAVKLTFWTFADWTTGASGDALNGLVQKFETENPSITVDVVGKTSTDIVTGVAANGATGSVDVVTTQLGPGSPLVGAGALLDVSDYWKKAGADYTGQFNTQFTDPMVRDGARYGVPFTLTSTVLYRNLDVLKSAGIDPSAGIPDWSAWLSDMQKIHDAGKFAIADSTNFWFPMLGFYSGADGVPANFSLAGNGKSSNLDVGALTSALSFVQKTLPFAAPVGSDDQGETDLFTTNQLAYIVSGAWKYPTFEAAAKDKGLKYDYIAVPGETAGKTGGVFDGEFFGIPVGSKHADAAWKFIQFMTESAQEAKFGASVGRLVANKDALSDPSMVSNAFIQYQAKAITHALNDAPFLQPVPADAPNAFADGGTNLKGGADPAKIAQEIITQYNASLASAS